MFPWHASWLWSVLLILATVVLDVFGLGRLGGHLTRLRGFDPGKRGIGPDPVQ